MKKLIIPCKGKKVRDPLTGRHIPDEGVARIVTSYYNRRLKDGDIEIRDLKAKKPSKTKSPDPESNQKAKSSNKNDGEE